MKKFEETIYLPLILGECLRHSPGLKLLGIVSNHNVSALAIEFYRGQNFFMMYSFPVVGDAEIDFWYDDEIEDLKDYLINDLRDAHDFEEAQDFLPGLKRVLSAVNSCDSTSPPLALGDGLEFLRG